MSEQELVKQCLDYLLTRGILAWRQNQGMALDAHGRRRIRYTSRDGISDILAVLPPHGTLFAFEMKVGKNKLRPNQQLFLDDVRSVGGAAIEVRSVDDVINAVELHITQQGG